MTARGYWGMACWNGLSADQQAMLIEAGVLFAGHWEPAGGTCDKGAEVSIETEWDTAPGPRFYCRNCAINYIAGLWRVQMAAEEAEREQQRRDGLDWTQEQANGNLHGRNVL